MISQRQTDTAQSLGAEHLERLTVLNPVLPLTGINTRPKTSNKSINRIRIVSRIHKSHGNSIKLSIVPFKNLSVNIICKFHPALVVKSFRFPLNTEKVQRPCNTTLPVTLNINKQIFPLNVHRTNHNQNRTPSIINRHLIRNLSASKTKPLMKLHTLILD